MGLQRVTVVDNRHDVWATLATHQGNLSSIIYALVENNEVIIADADADILRTWLVKLDAPDVLRFDPADDVRADQGAPCPQCGSPKVISSVDGNRIPAHNCSDCGLGWVTFPQQP